jgi:hypothetical protein
MHTLSMLSTNDNLQMKRITELTQLREENKWTSDDLKLSVVHDSLIVYFSDNAKEKIEEFMNFPVGPNINDCVYEVIGVPDNLDKMTVNLILENKIENARLVSNVSWYPNLSYPYLRKCIVELNGMLYGFCAFIKEGKLRCNDPCAQPLQKFKESWNVTS